MDYFKWNLPAFADEVSVTVEESPTISAAGDDQTICATTATLAEIHQLLEVEPG